VGGMVHDIKTITYGRINSRLGQTKIMAFDEFEQAHTHFKKICSIRQKRHYQIIEQNNRPFSSQKDNKTNHFLHQPVCQKEKNKNKLGKFFYMGRVQNSFLNQLFDL